MAKTPNPHLGLALISLFLISPITNSASIPDTDFDPPPVFDILPQFGFPGGLLPSSVVNYTLGPDGQFAVELEKPCHVQFEYLVYYEKTIKGKLGYGYITDLEGIKVRRFFIWFDVDQITVDLPPSDSIYFQFGLVNRKMDVDQFETVHSCRDERKGPRRGSWKWFLEFPTPIEELPMLLTE